MLLLHSFSGRARLQSSPLVLVLLEASLKLFALHHIIIVELKCMNAFAGRVAL
jgi:hypothetical protein